MIYSIYVELLLVSVNMSIPRSHIRDENKRGFDCVFFAKYWKQFAKQKDI